MIDLDYSQLGRDKVIESVIEKWGRERVANIITHTTFKPKGILERWTKLAAPRPEEETALKKHYQTMAEIKAMIPSALFGKEATLDEIVNGNDKKGYKPHPELTTEDKYKEFYRFAKYMEGMVQNFSFHPAGLIISNDPLHEHVPIWKNGKCDYITQFDMNECSELGLT